MIIYVGLFQQNGTQNPTLTVSQFSTLRKTIIFWDIPHFKTEPYPAVLNITQLVNELFFELT